MKLTSNIGGIKIYIIKMHLDKLIAFKDTDFIKVITGVRKSGKSIPLKQI